MYRNNSPYVHTSIKRMKGYGNKHDPVARGEIFAVGKDVADQDGDDMEGGFINPLKLIRDGKRYAEDASLDILSKSGVLRRNTPTPSRRRSPNHEKVVDMVEWRATA